MCKRACAHRSHEIEYNALSHFFLRESSKNWEEPGDKASGRGKEERGLAIFVKHTLWLSVNEMSISIDVIQSSIIAEKSKISSHVIG